MQELGGPINSPEFSMMKHSYRAKDVYVMQSVLQQTKHQLCLPLPEDWNSGVAGPPVTLVFHERMPRIGLVCADMEGEPLATLVAFYLTSLLNLSRVVKVRRGGWMMWGKGCVNGL